MKILGLILGIVFLLLLVGGGGYWLLAPHEEIALTSPLQPTATLMPSPAPITPTGVMLERDTQEIKTLVKQFYVTYQTCLKQPPPAAKGRVATYCQAHIGLTSETFTANLQSGGTARRGADPITCSQNPPSSASAEAIDYEAPDKAVATTVLLFGSGFAQKVPVVVVKENTKWWVDMVNCSRS